MDLKIEHEIFYGQTEYETENKMHMFLDDPKVIYVDSEDYGENDRSYATVLSYQYTGKNGDGYSVNWVELGD